MKVKPILFNTEMVRANLDGRKSCTRRLVKGFVPDDAIWGYTAFTPKGYISCRGTFADGYGEKFFKLPYQKGDILYVRETFAWCPCWDCGMESICNQGKDRRYHDEKKEYGCYMYRASCEDNEYPSVDIWHPSIHMPKEAARIWLKVTDVRVERLQEITEEQACMEGTDPWDEACYENNGWHPTFSDPDSGGEPNMIDGFHKLWNSTIKKTDLDRNGWNANPWVWVIEFERCEEPEGEE